MATPAETRVEEIRSLLLASQLLHADIVKKYKELDADPTVGRLTANSLRNAAFILEETQVMVSRCIKDLSGDTEVEAKGIKLKLVGGNDDDDDHAAAADNV